MENPTYRTPRRLALSLLLAAALVPAAHGQSKDEAHAQMIDLQAQIAALKGQSSVEAQQQLAALASQLHDLSASLGGDLPCATGELSAGGGSAPAGGPPLPTGCTTTTTNFTQSTAVAIPAGPAVVSSTLDVSGVDTYLWDLNITTGITHTFPGDLDITITSPAGTVVTLTTDNAGTNDDVFNGTVWDDSANPGGQVPYTSNNGLVTDQVYVSGTLASPLVPEESLAAFVGEDPNGTWTLTISDDTGGDAGNLSSWTLAVSTFPQAPNLDPVASFDQATAVAIPAGPAVVSSDLVVSGLTNPICKVELRSAVRHTFPGDLDVTLTSPDGIIVTLTTDNAGTNDDVFNGTVWRDDANPAGQVPYTTNNGIVTDQVYAISTLASPLVVEESLGAFMGFDGNGTWTLTVSDDSGGDAGSVDSWGLDFTTCSCAINADLSITKTDGVASAVAGSTTTYTIVASNAGPADAIGATVADSFPAACTSVSWSCVGAGGATCSANGTGNISDLVDLPAGGSATYTAICAIDPAATGTLDNTATVTEPAGVTDTDPINNSATDSDALGASTDLSITKVAQGVPDPILLGSTFSYLLTVTNGGPSAATGVMVNDTLPSTIDHVSNDCGAAYADPTLSWNIGNLAAAGSVSCTVTVSVAELGQIANTATVSSATTDPTGANNSATATLVGAQPADVALLLSSTAPPSLAVGETYSYNVIGTNNGPGTAAGLTFTLELSSKISFISSTCGATLAGNTLSWSVATLANGASTSCQIDVVVVLAGDVLASANVSTVSVDPDLSNNSAQLVVGTGAVAVPVINRLGLLLLLLLTTGLAAVFVRRH